MSIMINYEKELIRISPTDFKKIEVSTNDGRTWNSRYGGSSLQGNFQDLTDNGKEILATTEKGLFVSKNTGRTWNMR